jgi:hypothetical protein
MAYLVLVAWLIQGSVGIALVLKRVRDGQAGPTMITHVALGITALALWLVFLLQESLLAGWLAFALITVGNSFGDYMMIQRWRRTSGFTSGFWPDYGRAIAAAFRGAMPRAVVFHALFAGVVYFSCVAVCIGASIA